MLSPIPVLWMFSTFFYPLPVIPNNVTDSQPSEMNYGK